MNTRWRYKRGWFGESHRHYLASKGITTGRISTKPKKYFQVRNDLKGNHHQGDSGLARLRGMGWTDEEIANNPEGAIEASKEGGSPVRFDTIESIVKKVEKKRQRDFRTQQAIYEDELGISASPGGFRPVSSEIPVVGGSSQFEPVVGATPQLEPVAPVTPLVTAVPERKVEPEEEIGKEIVVTSPGVAATPGVPPPSPSAGFDVQ